jgi:hypothetical protein
MMIKKHNRLSNSQQPEGTTVGVLREWVCLSWLIVGNSAAAGAFFDGNGAAVVLSGLLFFAETVFGNGELAEPWLLVLESDEPLDDSESLKPASSSSWNFSFLADFFRFAIDFALSRFKTLSTYIPS